MNDHTKEEILSCLTALAGLCVWLICDFKASEENKALACERLNQIWEIRKAMGVTTESEP